MKINKIVIVSVMVLTISVGINLLMGKLLLIMRVRASVSIKPIGESEYNDLGVLI